MKLSPTPAVEAPQNTPLRPNPRGPRRFSMFFDTSMGDVANSPFIVPVAGCAMIACIVIANGAASTRKRQIESEERLAAIARGIAPPPTMAEIALTQNRPTQDIVRRRANIRLAGIILVASSIALALFFVILYAVLGQREILSGVACALIPLGIGAGLLIDARIQTREIEETTQPNSLNS